MLHTENTVTTAPHLVQDESARQPDLPLAHVERDQVRVRAVGAQVVQAFLRADGVETQTRAGTLLQDGKCQKQNVNNI